MNDRQITSPRQMDEMIDVAKPGPFIVLGVLLLAVAAAMVFVFVGSLERKTVVIAHCDGAIDQERIQAYFSQKLNIEDENAYQVIFSYLDKLDDSGRYTLFDTVMPEDIYLKSGITTGSRVRFENGTEGIVVGGTTAAEYEDLFGAFFSYTDEDLLLMNVCPGQAPYCMCYIFTGETDEDMEGTHLSCDIITESISLTDVLFEDTDA